MQCTTMDFEAMHMQRTCTQVTADGMQADGMHYAGSEGRIVQLKARLDETHQGEFAAAGRCRA